MAHASYILIMCIILFSSILCKEVKKLINPIPSLEKEVTKKTEEKRKVTINNTIEQKDLGYYKFFMTHYPSEFYIQVNGKKLESKEKLVVDESKLTVTYTYEWSVPLGKVKKSKTLMYDIDPKIEKIDLSFTSWNDNEPRIKAPGCSFVKVTEVEETNTIPKEKMDQFIAQAGPKNPKINT